MPILYKKKSGRRLKYIKGILRATLKFIFIFILFLEGGVHAMFRRVTVFVAVNINVHIFLPSADDFSMTVEWIFQINDLVNSQSHDYFII